MSADGEHSFVADQINWAARIRVEEDSSKAWEGTWGTLFSDNKELNYEDKIKQLEEQLNNLPPVQARTVNSLYGPGENGRGFEGEVASKKFLKSKKKKLIDINDIWGSDDEDDDDDDDDDDDQNTHK